MANFMLFMILLISHLSSLMHIQNYEFLAGLGLATAIQCGSMVFWCSVYITDESFSII